MDKDFSKPWVATPLIESLALSVAAEWYVSQHLLFPLPEFPSLWHHALEPLIRNGPKS
jgi:hypothetical protein